MSDLLEYLTIEDLDSNNRQLAELVGMEGFKNLVRCYGGTANLYIPKADRLVIPIRDTLICREFNGSNSYELSMKWNLTERYIRDIVKDRKKELTDEALKGQISFFELE